MTTPFYDKNGITIWCGKFPDISPVADLIITDPPYGINHPTNYHSRGRGKIAKCTDYPPVAGDNTPFDPTVILSMNLPSVIWGANHFASRLPDASGWLVWDKQRPPALDQSTCELAWTNFVRGVRIFHHLWNGCMRASERGSGKLKHPTQKPVELISWILSLKWTPHGTILDPYMGAGSTLLAAKRAGRKAIGIELSEDYCRIAAERLDAE